MLSNIEFSKNKSSIIFYSKRVSRTHLLVAALPRFHVQGEEITVSQVENQGTAKVSVPLSPGT